MHRDDMLLASTRSGTLQLTVDPTTGLDYTATLPECRSDVYELVQRGDIGESSFSFVIISANGDRWDYSDGMPLRTLLSGKLLDVAPVNQGAYSGNTSVGLRSLARYMDAPIEDVTDAVLANEVRRFFTRTDRQLSFPPKPASDSGVRVRATARQRQLEVLACRWETPKTEQTEQQQAVEAMRDNHITPLTVRQKQVEVMRQRWPAERRSGRSALLETLAAQDDWNE
jgi:Caudovirus prohead serine protease